MSKKLIHFYLLLGAYQDGKTKREKINNVTGLDGTYSFSYVVLTALNISSNTKLRYEFNYYFGNDGKLNVSEPGSATVQHSKSIEFVVNIVIDTKYLKFFIPTLSHQIFNAKI